MQTIWKFPLQTTDVQDLEMPVGAEILCVQWQHTQLCVWARVDTDCFLAKRRIITHGTGHPVPETTGRYIGTYQLNAGDLVFHVFEATP